MAFVVVTGVRELDQALKQVARGVKARASKRAVQFTGGTMVRDVRPQVPKGPTGNLRRKVRFRWIRASGQITNGKVVLGARHAAIVTLGTKPRFRDKKGIGGKYRWTKGGEDPRSKSTGAGRPNPFFRLYIGSHQVRYARILRERLKLYVGDEITKAGLRGGKR